MRTLTAEEIMMALKRQVKRASEEAPDFTSAEPEKMLEPTEMPTGQGEIK